MLYHMAMARREVLVQLDDRLVEQLDRIGDDRGVSRSELLRRGAQAVIDAEDRADDDIALVEAYKRQPPDPALVRSAAALGGRTSPPW